MKQKISFLLALCMLLTVIPFTGITASAEAKTGVDVQFRNMDTTSHIMTYFKDNGCTAESENYLEGTGSIRCQIKEDKNILYLFLQAKDNINIAGASHLAFDIWVAADNYFDGGRLKWSDMRVDDRAHENQWGEYDNVPAITSIDTDGVRKTLSGLKAGWNHVLMPLDFVTECTDAVSLRLRLEGDLVNVKTGDFVYFDDFRFVSPDVAEDGLVKRNAAKDVTVQIRALPALDALTLEQAEQVKAAKAAYDAVDEAYKSIIMNPEKLASAVAKINDMAAAAAVEALIAQLPAEITEEHRGKVEAARAAYNGLTEDQKSFVTNLSVLLAAETALSDAKADLEAAAAVDKMIEQLPNSVGVTDEAAVQAVRAAFNGLTDLQQTLVTKLSVLIAAENMITDKKAAAAVDAAIAQLPATVTLQDKEAIRNVRAAYNQLTDAQKEFVEKLDVLTAAEAVLASLGFVVDGKLDSWYRDTDASGLNQYHFSSKEGEIDAYLSSGGWDMYDGDRDTDVEFWTAYDEEYIYVYAKVYDTDLNIKSDNNYSDSLTIYLDPDPMSRSKSSNPEGHFYVHTEDPAQGDIGVRLRGKDLYVDDYHDIEKVGYSVPLKSYFNDTSNYCPFRFDDNEDGVDDGYGVEARFPRNDDESGQYRINFANGSFREDDTQRYTYSFGRAWWMDYSSMMIFDFDDENNPFLGSQGGNEEDPDQQAADKVDALIAALPATVTEANRKAVEEARAAYNALTAAQKALVKNYETLVKAEKALEKPVDPVMRGDVNGDKKVDAKDALLVLKAAVGKEKLTPEQEKIADLTGDSKINASDALIILKIAVGKEA